MSFFCSSIDVLVSCSSKRPDTNLVEDPDPHQRERADTDLHQRERSDPDPHQSEKVDSNPQKISHLSEKADPDQHQSQKPDPDPHQRDADPHRSLLVLYRKVPCAGILEQSMGANSRVGRGLSYRPARLNRLEESIHWNRFPGSLKV